MPRVIPITITTSDVRDLLIAKAQLDGVVNALRHTNWAGAEASINSLGFIELLIMDLYNRAEPHWLRYLERGKAHPDQDAASEQAGGEMHELVASASGSEPGKLAAEHVDSTSTVVCHGADELASTIEVPSCTGETTRGE